MTDIDELMEKVTEEAARLAVMFEQLGADKYANAIRELIAVVELQKCEIARLKADPFYNKYVNPDETLVVTYSTTTST